MGYIAWGPGVIGPAYLPAAPTAGTDEAQTLTFGGTPTGGTYRLDIDGNTTGPITWTNVNATCLNNLQAGLDAAVGANSIVATLGTLAAGIGTIVLTYSGSRFAKRAMPTATVAANNLTGTSPTIGVVETVAGVTATNQVGAPPGAMIAVGATGKLMVNTGTAAAPTWTAQA